MVTTRGKAEELAAKQRAEEEEKTRELESVQHLGRGCRERKQTTFFEEDILPTYAKKPRQPPPRPERTATSPGLVINSRYPQREAAKRAIARIEGDDSSESEWEQLPDEKPKNKKKKDDDNLYVTYTVPRKSQDEKIETILDSEDDDDESDDESDCSSEDPVGMGDRNASDLLKNNRSLNHALQRSLPTAGDVSKKRRRSGAPKYDDDDDDDQKDGAGKSGDTLGDITPLAVDPSVTFNSVGGLPQHILQLREMVLLPLMYPNLLENLSLSPPRGVLFVGPPGTGKTLMARALANEGMQQGERRISFFMRKGADILSKWVGESEKQLRLLFDEAKRRQPSIIFFDEIDGLAPVRHSKQEQSHAALVSTLLALMDGMDSRGQVIVIGATNRPDTIDPALRRPGRFDRELRFPVPDDAARRHIINIQLGKDRTDDGTIDFLLRHTEGWSGADLRAVCTEASLCALRRAVPQIYVSSERLKVAGVEENIKVGLDDFRVAVRRMQPSVARTQHGGEVPGVDEHLEILLHEARESLATEVGKRYAPAAQAIKDKKRRCDDLHEATMALTELPPPTISSALFVGIRCNEDSFVSGDVCSLVSKSFPSFFSRCVHLPNLMAGLGVHSANHADEVMGAPTMDGSSFASVCRSIVACTPATLILSGLETWLEQLPDDEATVNHNIALLRYNLTQLLHSNVLVLIPTAQKDTFSKLLPPTLFPPHVAAAFDVTPEASENARLRFFQHIGFLFESHRSTLMAPPEKWAELEVDNAPLPKPKRTAHDKRMAFEKWDKIQHKRRQLCHILHQRTVQYCSNQKYKPLLSKDVDFEPGSDDLRKWERHTRGRRLGLEDILEKLERDEYVAVSQYNVDMDIVCTNITSHKKLFPYRGNDARVRIRNKARDLRETTLLNNYKINKKLVAFCEENIDEEDPEEWWESSSDDEEYDENVQRKGAKPSGKKGKTNNSQEVKADIEGESDDDLLMGRTDTKEGTSPVQKQPSPVGETPAPRNPSNRSRSSKKSAKQQSDDEDTASSDSSSEDEEDDGKSSSSSSSSSDSDDDEKEVKKSASNSKKGSSSAPRRSLSKKSVSFEGVETTENTRATTADSTAGSSRSSSRSSTSVQRKSTSSQQADVEEEQEKQGDDAPPKNDNNDMDAIITECARCSRGMTVSQLHELFVLMCHELTAVDRSVVDWVPALAMRAAVGPLLKHKMKQ